MGVGDGGMAGAGLQDMSYRKESYWVSKTGEGSAGIDPA